MKREHVVPIQVWLCNVPRSSRNLHKRSLERVHGPTTIGAVKATEKYKASQLLDFGYIGLYASNYGTGNSTNSNS